MPKRKKLPENVIAHWKNMVDHIDKSWKSKKGMGYPWRGMDFKELRPLANRCEAWGVMALWDLYMEGWSYWSKKTGYMIVGFMRDIGILLDNPGFKGLSKKYHDSLEPQMMSPKEALSKAGLCHMKQI